MASFDFAGATLRTNAFLRHLARNFTDKGLTTHYSCVTVESVVYRRSRAGVKVRRRPARFSRSRKRYPLIRLESVESPAQICQRHDVAIASGLTRCPAVDDGLGGDVRDQTGNAVKRITIIRCNSGAGLDLDSPDTMAGFIEDVAFQPPRIPEKGEVGLPAPVEAVLERLRNDHVLEERSTKGMGGHLIPVLDADQIACQPAALGPSYA